MWSGNITIKSKRTKVNSKVVLKIRTWQAEFVFFERNCALHCLKFLSYNVAVQVVRLDWSFLVGCCWMSIARLATQLWWDYEEGVVISRSFGNTSPPSEFPEIPLYPLGFRAHSNDLCMDARNIYFIKSAGMIGGCVTTPLPNQVIMKGTPQGLS